MTSEKDCEECYYYSECPRSLESICRYHGDALWYLSDVIETPCEHWRSRDNPKRHEKLLTALSCLDHLERIIRDDYELYEDLKPHFHTIRVVLVPRVNVLHKLDV